MFHKIGAASLVAGMYVANTGVSWLQHPYLYTEEGELTGQELTRLLEEGYTEAYIDLSRCRPGTLSPELEALIPSVVSANPADMPPPPPQSTLEEELPKARAVFSSSLSMARNMMDALRAGQPFDLPAAEPLVENILESLDRNADALFSLCKLRQTDDYTYTHCVNVSVLTVMFARGLGLGEETLRGLGLGALFHDVGKALVPLRILQAPRRLSDTEMAIMKRHPQLGFDFLNQYKTVPPEVFQVVLEHHEQYCGLGYPCSLKPQAISLAGRIAAVVDVFDALSSKRVYKAPMPLAKTLSILYSMREKEFFPGMVERFIRLLGVYPLGSVVELEDGSCGVICEANSASPMKPVVTLVRDSAGKNCPRIKIDLSRETSLSITRSIAPGDLGIDPAAVLGLP